MTTATLTCQSMIETGARYHGIAAERFAETLSEARAQRAAQGMTPAGRLAWRRYAGGISSAHYAKRNAKAVARLVAMKAGR